jgi:glycosyl transferase family 25
VKVYVINLDRRKDRLEFMLKQAEARSFTFERIAAVDGTAPDLLARAENLRPGFQGMQISSTELACFESHRKAWEAFLETGESYGLIMEDDVVVSPEFADFLNDSWIPEDADFVRLETFLRLTNFDLRPVSVTAGRRLHRLRSSIWGAGAYVLSRQVAERLLEETTVPSDPVDDVLFDERSPFFSRFITYQMIPAPAIQGDKLKTTSQEDWVRSSLKADRHKRALPDLRRPGLQRFRVWRRIKYRAQRLAARLQGRLLNPVPFK